MNKLFSLQEGYILDTEKENNGKRMPRSYTDNEQEKNFQSGIMA